MSVVFIYFCLAIREQVITIYGIPKTDIYIYMYIYNACKLFLAWLKLLELFSQKKKLLELDPTRLGLEDSHDTKKQHVVEKISWVDEDIYQQKPRGWGIRN